MRIKERMCPRLADSAARCVRLPGTQPYCGLRHLRTCDGIPWIEGRSVGRKTQTHNKGSRAKMPQDEFSCPTHLWATVLVQGYSATGNRNSAFVKLLQPTDHVMHQQFHIEQLYVLPTLYLCVLCLSENKQRLVSLTA